MNYLELDTSPVKHNCKGLIFRAQAGTYLDARGNYNQRVTMLLLKKKSCPGCERCGYLLDDLAERVGEDFAPDISHAKHGALYRLVVSDVHRDWETGIVDEWGLEFIQEGRGENSYRNNNDGDPNSATWFTLST